MYACLYFYLLIAKTEMIEPILQLFDFRIGSIQAKHAVNQTLIKA